MRTVIVGSRGSDLALAQTRQIIEDLERFHPGRRFELRIIKTSGDAIQDKKLSEMGGQGVFTKELEHALLEGQVDLAIHSLKDLPSTLPEGLALAAVPPRESPVEALCGSTLNDLQEGARIGTGAPRRVAQLKHLRSDLECEAIRGNVPTRLARAGQDGIAAVLLAEAGLRRLGLQHAITERLSLDRFPPAVAQGALGLEIRTHDAEVRELLQVLDHVPTRLAVTAERGLLRALQAGCHTPIGALARFRPGPLLELKAQVTAVDASQHFQAQIHGRPDLAEDLARRLADDLLAQGAGALIDRT